MDNYDYRKLSKQTVLLNSTRVRRTYSGGRVIEEWQGKELSEDGNRPEEWVASVVEARNPGFEKIENEGLSTINTEFGSKITLKDIIASDPALFLGSKHYKKCGENTAVLVKLIDSLERLTIQVHPDKQFAKDVFGSNFGKTEAWYILGSRKGGEEPYLLFGFKKGVTRELWQDLFDRQDILAMMDCLHKIKPKEGEVFLIEGGVPHAIGPGCFLIEIQEPTDYTLRIERITPAGVKISDMLVHQGAGIEKLIDCFHYQDLTVEQTMDKWRIKPEIVRSENGSKEKVLIGKRHTKCFRMNELEVSDWYECRADDAFSALIIVLGDGEIKWADGNSVVKKSDQLFLPASLGGFILQNKGEKPMKILRCFPPE